MDEIGAVFGRSPNRIRQLERQAIAALGLALRSAAPTRLRTDEIEGHPWFPRTWRDTTPLSYDEGSPVAGAVRSTRSGMLWCRTSLDRWTDGTGIGTWVEMADLIGDFTLESDDTAPRPVDPAAPAGVR